MPLRSVGWIEDLLAHGAGRTDAIFLAEAWRRFPPATRACSHEVAELAAAFAPSAERRLETLAQGAAFLAATLTAVWPHAGAGGAAASRAPRSPIRWPSASALPRMACPCAATAQAFAQAFAANLVSAGVRLIPLGQTDGLRISRASSR